MREPSTVNIGIIFWIIMIVWLVFFVVEMRGAGRGAAWTAVTWVLLALLGWKVFGSPFH